MRTAAEPLQRALLLRAPAPAAASQSGASERQYAALDRAPQRRRRCRQQQVRSYREPPRWRQPHRLQRHAPQQVASSRPHDRPHSRPPVEPRRTDIANSAARHAARRAAVGSGATQR